MNRDDILRMAQEAGLLRSGDGWTEPHRWGITELERFAALVAAAEREKLAQWMVSLGYATGHGDTMEDLLEELEWQVTESWSKVVVASVEAERDRCILILERLHERSGGQYNYYLHAAKVLKGEV